MRRVDYLPAALADLDEIWSYIAQHDPDAADRLVERLRDAARSLAPNPFVDSPADWLKPGLRKKAVRGYIIFYRVAPRSVRIVRVVHGARHAAWLNM